MHQGDISKDTEGVEQKIKGESPVAISEDVLIIPTPGHTRGHQVLLYKNKFLFSGDHLWWNDERGTLSANKNVCWYSWPEQIRSMERLLDYSFEWVLPGHGHRHHAPSEEMHQLLEKCITRMKR